MGFSIKSKFGHNPTLFNAGSSSQFLYKLSGCDEAKMKDFNAITDKGGRGWSKCKEFLLQNLSLIHIYEPTRLRRQMCIRDRDRLIDSPKDYEVMETVERMIQANPLKVPNTHIYYEKAIKDFLMAGFTGMTAGKPWDGKEQVNGGYISVMDDGDVLCYHSNDREAFRDYLYRNTHFEYVSADKYVWSRIEKIDGDYYLPLNVSVRFNTKIR